MKSVMKLVLVVGVGLLFINGFSKGSSGNADAASPTHPILQPGVVLETTSLDIDFSKHAVTFIELGAKSCNSCKAMQPVMKDLAKARNFIGTWLLCKRGDPQGPRSWGLKRVGAGG